MGLVYRTFESRDFTDLAVLSDDEWKGNHFRVALAMTRTKGNVEQCILALDGDKIVGYIYAFALPNKALLPELLYVLPQYRRQGIGRKLLAKMEIATDCTSSMIFYHKSLHRFYSNLGYEVADNLEVALKVLPEVKEQTI